MANRLIDILTRKEKKRYQYIITLIENQDLLKLIDYDSDYKFGLTNQKYIDRIISRIEQEIIDHPEYLTAMNEQFYHRKDFFNNKIISENPNMIEYFIKSKSYMPDLELLILNALDNGYMPTNDYIINNERLYSNINIMNKLLEKGFSPNNQFIENHGSIFSNKDIFIKIFDLGYRPSIKFIKNYDLLKDNDLVDLILDNIEVNSEVINSGIFYGNAKAQQKIINEKPEMLLQLKPSDGTYNQFWIEAFKLNHIPLELNDRGGITSDFNLFSKVIKQKPELIKDCRISNEEEKKKIDELALNMGYVPSIEDAQNYSYVNQSFTIMQALVERRPEAIKFAKLGIEDFVSLSRFAIENGYIPTINDFNENPKLMVNSFEIMKSLISEDPSLIQQFIQQIGKNDTIPNQDELLRIAIENGFDSSISRTTFLYYDIGIKYQYERLKKMKSKLTYRLDLKEELLDDLKNIRQINYHGAELYNYLINEGFVIDDIINLFNNNYEAMRVIIESYPEKINDLSVGTISSTLSRAQVDELCLLAMQKGYIPKVEDKVFGYGNEVAKQMVKRFPEFIEKVSILDSKGLFNPVTKAPFYDEVCKIAIDAGYVPDVEKMGNGYGFMTTTKYNKSYDIMKKAIPQKPELIESCEVSNKEAYDELCKIAISYGYECKSEYALKHWGRKMLSNYDIMAKWIESNPSDITEIEVSDSEDFEKLISIAVKSGLDLSRINENSLLKIMLKIDEEKWSDYLDEYTIEKIQKVKELYENNDEISETIIPYFLTSNIANKFSNRQIEIISCYPNLQEGLLQLSSNEAEIIYEIINRYGENLEWISILEKSINNIYSSEYKSLLKSIENIDLTKEEKDNLLYLIMTNNHLDISSYDELKEINKKKENYINTLISRNTIGSLKSAYFEKKFGIDILTAINLVNTYGRSLESDVIDSLDDESRLQFEKLRDMKNIISINNRDVLKYYVEHIEPESIASKEFMLTFESKLKYVFTEQFNKSFTKPMEDDKVNNLPNEEKDFDVYLAAGKNGDKNCRMMITSIGAYTAMEEPDDYYASWNVNKIASHGCCCSYVGEKNLGTAEVKYCCLGFTDYEMGSLQLSGPYDLTSFSDDKKYQVSSLHPSMYLFPNDVLDYTRHTHNETVWERRTISEKGNFKKQPSYIVYFVDNFEDRLSDPEAMKQWKSVKKAASDFSINVNGQKKTLPIMVVEREKIAKHQAKKIDDNLERFIETMDASLIKDIISDYESNYAGNREYHLNISEKYFPQHNDLSNSVISKIIKTIKEKHSENPNNAIMCLRKLEEVIKLEQEKYNNTKHGVGQSEPSFNIEEALIMIGQIKSELDLGKDSPITIIDKCSGNERQFEKCDIDLMDSTTINSQLYANEVMSILEKDNLLATVTKYEEEINSENLNAKLKVHGQRHIKNVLLYSALIGKEVLTDGHDLELLLVAAKYHDIGRKTDAYENHAVVGAEKVEEKLKDTYSLNDVAIISTIIEFHEHPRNSNNAFYEIAKKYGIDETNIDKAMQLAEILKDADALDRTRFINRARLNPQFLKYDISKQLIKFASTVQETYAIEDLKEYNCNEACETLLQIYTPQEVIRTIRHSTRLAKNNQEIQDFIIMWANTIKQLPSHSQKLGIEAIDVQKETNYKNATEQVMQRQQRELENNIVNRGEINGNT